NDTAGLLDLQTDAGISGQGNDKFVDLGTLRKSAGSGASVINSGLQISGGTLDVRSGTLDVHSLSFNYAAGPINVVPGATLSFSQSSAINATGTFTATGGGKVT